VALHGLRLADDSVGGFLLQLGWRRSCVLSLHICFVMLEAKHMHVKCCYERLLRCS
jgi:hypothetical protein